MALPHQNDTILGLMAVADWECLPMMDREGARFTFDNMLGVLSDTSLEFDDTSGVMRVRFSCTAAAAIAHVGPVAAIVADTGGLLLLPGRERPFDPRDRIATGCTIALSVESLKGWALNSQRGCECRFLECRGGEPALRLQRHPDRADWWVVSLGVDGVAADSTVECLVEIRALPFNGAASLRHVEQWLAHHPPPPKAEPASDRGIAHHDIFTPDETGVIRFSADGAPVTLRFESAIDLPLWADVQAAVRPAMIDTEPVTEVEVTIRARDGGALESLRVEAEIETPCGNPTWEGPATVFVPGNFARCNYHPDYLHGGGPKWGPDPVPTEREPLTANDEAPGRCHGWTFSSSRLPQVWTAAIDRHGRTMVWAGTEPMVDGEEETAAGFVSPEGKTTTLRLAFPTTYEPWVPLGYSRMRREPLRKTTAVREGRDRVTWRFWVARRETADLNAWGALDRALYRRNRPLQPSPIRHSLEDALRICAEALFTRFYKPARQAMTYSTGPQGQHALVGFTGMAHSALVMKTAGERFDNADWRDAGNAVLDTVAAMFLEGPEFPWTLARDLAAGETGPRFVHGSGEPGYVVMVAFDNLAEAAKRARATGHPRPEWERALRRCADAWKENQNADGRFPHWGPGFSPDFKANEYGCTNIEAGVMANLVDAWELFGDARYLDAARRAAVVYGADLDEGRLWGGPGDIRALVNSEVPMLFLRGFRRLYEATRDDEHLRLLRISAAWRLSFQYAHSWFVDEGTPLFRQGWAGLGSEGASACNLHSVAFGGMNIPDLWALWQFTGDDTYRMRAEDLARYMTQQYARYAGDLGFPFAGAGTESWWTSESVWGKGVPWIFTDPGFDLGYMSWVTGWSGYGALQALERGIRVD